MDISVKVDKRSERVLLDIGNAPRKIKRQLKPALNEIGALVGRENKRLITSGKRSGRVYNIAGRTHVASAFGEAPANITGRLHKSYDYRVSSWHTMKVGEGADYAKFLEDGTKFMKPRQHVILAINNTSGDAVNILYRYGKRAMGVK